MEASGIQSKGREVIKRNTEGEDCQPGHPRPQLSSAINSLTHLTFECVRLGLKLGVGVD